MTAASEHGTIPRMVLASCDQHRERTAVVDGKRRLSFQDVADEMLKVGSALIERGVQHGDRVAVWAPNSAVWVTAALGVLSAGAWLVPVNTRYMPREVQYLLDKTEAKVLMLSSGFMGIDPGQLDVAGSPGDWNRNLIHLPLSRRPVLTGDLTSFTNALLTALRLTSVTSCSLQERPASPRALCCVTARV
jgi:HIP---CoA ligase